jgi:UDP-N-acetylglucosamine transferase subunit ALG13
MNRVIDEIDCLIEEGKISANDVVIQGGVSKPSKYAKFYKMIDEAMFNYYVEKCSLLITHAGTSSIIKGLKRNKKVIIIPRKKKFDEHVDDHQQDIASVFKKRNYAEIIENIKDLGYVIDNIFNQHFNVYKPNEELAMYIAKKYFNR